MTIFVDDQTLNMAMVDSMKKQNTKRIDDQTINMAMDDSMIISLRH